MQFPQVPASPQVRGGGGRGSSPAPGTTQKAILGEASTESQIAVRPPPSTRGSGPVSGATASEVALSGDVNTGCPVRLWTGAPRFPGRPAGPRPAASSAAPFRAGHGRSPEGRSGFLPAALSPELTTRRGRRGPPVRGLRRRPASGRTGPYEGMPDGRRTVGAEAPADAVAGARPVGPTPARRPARGFLSIPTAAGFAPFRQYGPRQVPDGKGKCLVMPSRDADQPSGAHVFGTCACTLSASGRGHFRRAPAAIPARFRNSRRAECVQGRAAMPRAPRRASRGDPEPGAGSREPGAGSRESGG